MSELKPAEIVLFDLGVTDPKEIDVEAIAYAQGLRIRYRPLESCDACIMAVGDRGIITVNSNCAPQRQRFSIAHELGHWQFHRGRISMCTAGVIEAGNRRRGALDDERVADRFGSELLMPTYLLKPAVGKIAKLDWGLVRRIGSLFNTSLPATAIRLVEANIVPSLLVCHRQGGRAWFVRAPDVPDHWFPQDQLSVDSTAFNFLMKGLGNDRPSKTSADVWFNRRGSEQYEIEEQACLTSTGDVLSLLNIIDRRMI